MGDPGSSAPGALPPPPVAPLRSPPVAVRGEIERIVPAGPTHPVIEARIHAPEGARRAVLLCHPHPLYGGSMHSPVPLAIAKYLADVAGPSVAWARFNFRGVGSSGGSYGAGDGEVEDARAMLDLLQQAAPGAALSVCGHSFGAWVALQVAARAAPGAAAECALLVAPSAQRFGGDASRPRGSRVTVFIGDHDEFCSVGQARALAAELEAELRVFAGFDHHFLKSRRALAEAALPVIAPEVVRP